MFAVSEGSDIGYNNKIDR